MKRAFTLAETLTAMAVAVIIAAIAIPMLRSGKESSQRSVSVSNLKQLYSALSLYRSMYDGDGKYGDYAAMGLPPDLKNLAVQQNLPRSLFHSGCPPIHPEAMAVGMFRRMWHQDGPNQENWAPFALRMGPQSVLLGDVNCDFRDRYAGNPMMTHRGIGLYDAGNVRTVVRYGSPQPYEWWTGEQLR